VLVQAQEHFLGEILSHGPIARVEREQADQTHVLPPAQLGQCRIDLVGAHCRSLTGAPDIY
jgi:hypothetical protein